MLLAASFATGSYYVCIQIHTTCCCFPRSTTKAFGAQKGSLRGVQDGSRPKKAHTTKSQQPACTHEEHQILTTAEATAFADQHSDRKVYPTKTSQHEFLATCIDVDLEQKVKHAGRQTHTRKRGHRVTYFVPYCGSRRQSVCSACFVCIVQFAALCSKM